MGPVKKLWIHRLSRHHLSLSKPLYDLRHLFEYLVFRDSLLLLLSKFSPSDRLTYWWDCKIEDSSPKA